MIKTKIAVALATLALTTGALASDKNIGTETNSIDNILTQDVETKTLRPNCGGSCSGGGIGL